MIDFIKKKQISPEDLYLSYCGKEICISDGLVLGRGNGHNEDQFQKKLFLTPLDGDFRIPKGVAVIVEKNGNFFLHKHPICVFLDCVLKKEHIFIQDGEEIFVMKKPVKLKEGLNIIILNEAYTIHVMGGND